MDTGLASVARAQQDDKRRPEDSRRTPGREEEDTGFKNVARGQHEESRRTAGGDQEDKRTQGSRAWLEDNSRSDSWRMRTTHGKTA